MKPLREENYTKNILLLGIVSFLNDLSSEMIIPILPMFITALGGNGFIVGIIGGLRDSISNILKVFSGYWSDKTGKRKIYVAYGYLTSSIFKLFLGLSTTWQHILLFATLERMGKGLRTAPRDAIIAESMPAKKGKGFGIHRSLDTLGAISGGAIVFLLYWYLNLSFNTLILIAAAIAFLSLIPLYFVKEIRRRAKNITLVISLKKLPPPLKHFIIISSLFSIANFSYMFFILKAQQIFIGKSSIGIPILLYLIFNITYATLAIPFGLLSDKIGKKMVIILGYFIFSITSLGFAYASNLLIFIFLFILYGIVYAIVDGNQRAYVSDLAQEELKGTALGVYHTITGLASLAGSLTAGILWQINVAYTFIFGTILSAISSLLLAILKEQSG